MPVKVPIGREGALNSCLYGKWPFCVRLTFDWSSLLTAVDSITIYDLRVLCVVFGLGRNHVRKFARWSELAACD